MEMFQEQGRPKLSIASNQENQVVDIMRKINILLYGKK